MTMTSWVMSSRGHTKGVVVQRSSREPAFVHSEEDAARLSPLAAEFQVKRRQGNAHITAADDPVLKRFFNIDTNAYLDGAVPARYKELIGLSSSMVLRCDDCVFYHAIQAWRLGCERKELEESLNIAVVIGGSITIPHLRRVHALLAELYASV